MVADDGAGSVETKVSMTDLRLYADSCIAARHCAQLCMAALSNLDEERHTKMFHAFEPLLYSAHQCC